jgi:hypothetical protein
VNHYFLCRLSRESLLRVWASKIVFTQPGPNPEVERAFDKTVADREFFIDADRIIEDNEREEFFNNPQNERT